MRNIDVIIIGAGAAGMMAAVSALEEHKSVLLVESNERIGKKILATGNGKCNFTHDPILETDYYCDNNEMLNYVLDQFSSEDAISFFHELGMESKNKNGYLYPVSEQASTVLNMFQIRLLELGCKIEYNKKYTTAVKTSNGFEVKLAQDIVSCKALIIATGSRAGGFLETKDEDPYRLAYKLGVKSSKLFPALTKCKCKENFFKDIAGVRCEAIVSIYDNQKFVQEEQGELQLTSQGISGIVVFQMAGYIAEKLDEKHIITAHINFLPYLNTIDLNTFLHNRYEKLKNRTIKDFFLGLLNLKLLTVIFKIMQIDENAKASDYTEEQLLNIFRYAMDFTTEITSVADMKDAQVCHGGLMCNQFTKQLESINCPGLYACGEVLNVDGKCGGYNLHWAWASGYVAGKSATQNC